MSVKVPLDKNMKGKKVVACFSGGLDSTVLLAALLKRGCEVRALSVDYGQRHGWELGAAEKIGRFFDIEHRIIYLQQLKQLLGGSSQTDGSVDVPEGHYAAESMKVTVVPNRNMILLALATAWAVSTKSDYVGYAAHAGDHAIYPDCREEFASAMGDAIGLCDYRSIGLLRPFVELSKADLVRLGTELGAPLDLTYSCYKGAKGHCGKCGTCVERREAFQLAGVDDPTRYDAIPILAVTAGHC